MRVLVTGGGGFVGRHLVSALREAGHEAVPLTSPRGSGGERVELMDASAALDAIRKAHPDAVIHLAARGKPPGIEALRGLLDNNLNSALNVLEGVRQAAPRARVIVASSSAVYGRVPRERNPVTEVQPLEPALPYGASKLAVEAVASVYATHGLDVVIVRPFNLVGPGQSSAFAIANFARQIARLEGRSEALLIETGPLSSVRDFLDVRDGVRAYIQLLDARAGIGPFNLCSGVPRRLQDALDGLMGIAAVRARVSERSRLSAGGPGDVPYQCGSRANLTRATAWEPTIDWSQTLRDILMDWRNRTTEA